MAAIGFPASRELPTVKLSARAVRTLARNTRRLDTLEVLDDRYELRRRLGTGGSGEVYEAWDRVLERIVTVKRMRHDVVADPQAMDRFRREALSLAEIDSDRVVRIIDLRIRPEGSYQVLAHVPGQSLDRVVEACGPVPALTALRIARDILEGLAGLHRADITHRDVKPANVLIGEDGRATLLDLGIARSGRRKAITPAAYTVGTPLYMAPEQRRTSAVDGRTDLYQVGLLLIYATTATEPQSETELALAFARMEPRIGAVVARALAPVEERFQTANEMIVAVNAAMQPTIELGLEDIESQEIPVEIEAPAPASIPAPAAAASARPRYRWMLAIATIAIVAGVAWGGPHRWHPFRPAPSTLPASTHATADTTPAIVSLPTIYPLEPNPEHIEFLIDRPLLAPTDAVADLESWLDRAPTAAHRAPRAVHRREAKQPATTTPVPVALADARGESEADVLLRRAAAYDRNDAPELAVAALRAFLRIESVGERADAARARLAQLTRAR